MKIGLRTDNSRYLQTKQDFFLSQKLLNLGGERCMVLRLTLRRSLAEPHNYLPFHNNKKKTVYYTKHCTVLCSVSSACGIP